jgi:hypothetical protein
MSTNTSVDSVINKGIYIKRVCDMKAPNFSYKEKIYKIITDKTKLILPRTIFPYILQYQKYLILMIDKRLLSVMVATLHSDSRLIRT